MKNLIKIELKEDVQVVDSRLVANGLNINHKSLMETIRKYQKDLEDLGVLPFQTAKLDNEMGGRPESFCYLNELQCHFVATLSRNTPEVVQFKKALILAFDEAKKEINVLKEVIEESESFLKKKRSYYLKKGYFEKWTESRLQSLEVRSEWRKRGVENTKQFAVLTAISSKGVFGITPSEHRMLKQLKKHHNLRDNMTRLELAFVILSEEATIGLNETENPTNYDENKRIVEKSGKIAGQQRTLYEKQTGKKVLSPLNFLPENRKKYLKN